MCKCTPNKRTPFCGAPGCEWPPQAAAKPTIEELEAILGEPNPQPIEITNAGEVVFKACYPGPRALVREIAPMTNSELCERIARRWCELMKLNPDDVIQHASETVPPYSQYTPRWQWVALKVPEQLAWIQAVAEVVG